MTTIGDVLSTRLAPATRVPGHQWRLWEKKTFNIHRGVVHWRPDASSLSASDLSSLVRSTVKECFRISWWRGFGFGVVLELPSAPEGLESIHDGIDTTANSKGTWQWAVLSIDDVRATVGVHTWIKGYLTPVYQELLEHYRSQGHQVGSVKKEKGKALRLLMSLARLPVLGGGGLPEFDPDE